MAILGFLAYRTVMAKGVGLYSRSSTVASLDRRSTDGRFLAYVIGQLEAEMGGPDKVTFRQMLIIKGCADLVLRQQKAIGRYIQGDGDAARDLDRHVTLLQNAVVKSLKALDFPPVAEVAPTLAEYLSAKAAERVDDDNP